MKLMPFLDKARHFLRMESNTSVTGHMKMWSILNMHFAVVKPPEGPSKWVILIGLAIWQARSHVEFFTSQIVAAWARRQPDDVLNLIAKIRTENMNTAFQHGKTSPQATSVALCHQAFLMPLNAELTARRQHTESMIKRLTSLV